jgi:hypothetical protein
MSAVLTAHAPAVCPTAAASLRSATQVLLLGLTLTLVQTATVAALTGRSTVADAYHALYQWDSVWYVRSRSKAIPTAFPSAGEDMPTVSFFRLPSRPRGPGQLRAAGAHCGAGRSTTCLVGFWVYLLLFLRRWQTPLPVAVGCVLAILAHPAAFYLVAGYRVAVPLRRARFLYWQSTGTRRLGLSLPLTASC